MNIFTANGMKTMPLSSDVKSILITVLLNVLLLFIFVDGAFPIQNAETEEQKFVLPKENISVGDFVQYAYENNPSILEARESWNVSIENFQVKKGYPDPKVKVTYFPSPIETRLGPQDWNLTISQTIPFPGKLFKAGGVAKFDADIAKLKLDQTIRDVIVSIRESIYELQYIRKAKLIARQNQKLLEHLRKVAETQYGNDRTTLIDVVKAQSQVGQLQYDILLLDELEVTEMTNLNSILNRSPEEPIGNIYLGQINPVVFNLQEIYKIAEENQEEIKMASVRIEKAQAKADLSQFKNRPDFNIGLFYAGIGDPDVPVPPEDAGRDAIGIQAGFSIPLWFGRNKSRVNSSRAEERRAKASKVKRINRTRSGIRSIFFRLNNSERIVKLYQDELIPQAARAIELSETFYKEGESSFSDFIETQSVWYNFQLTLARAQSDYGKYIARLERLVGRDITRLDDESILNEAGEEK
jgi:outer membrane protein TolC